VSAQDAPVFRARIDVVFVPVTVTDRSGRFVRGLTADQFEISDGGSRRTITQFSADRVPVSLGILLDVSGSMAQDARGRAADDVRWADTRRALELLVTRLDAQDDVFFAAFAEKVGVALPWTSQHPRVLRAFDALRPGGQTALFNALRLIAPAFQLARYPRKALLLISDGRDTSVGLATLRLPTKADIAGNLGPSSPVNIKREAAIAGARDAIRASEAALYAIGIGTRAGASVDVETLERLTSDTGGYVEPLREPSEISAAVARICDDLQSQYILAFEPRHLDGKHHEISVRTKDTGLRVRARAEYVAPSAAAK
jgi:Ca-activated chloride channel family protein